MGIRGIIWVIIGGFCLWFLPLATHAHHPLLDKTRLSAGEKQRIDTKLRHYSSDFPEYLDQLEDSLASPKNREAFFALELLRAEYLMQTTRYRPALETLKPLLDSLNSGPDPGLLIRLYYARNTGVLYSLMGLMGRGGEELIQALELAQEFGNPDEIVLCYLELAELSRKRNDPPFVLSYLESAEQVQSAQPLSPPVLAYYHNRRISLLAYRAHQNYFETISRECDSALKYARVADLPYLIASTENELGMLTRDATMETAAQHWLAAAAIWEKLGAERDLTLAYHNLGVALMDIGQCDSAYKYLGKAKHFLGDRIWAYLSVAVNDQMVRYYQTCQPDKDSLISYLQIVNLVVRQESHIWLENRNFAADHAFQAENLKASIAETEEMLKTTRRKRTLTILFSVLLALVLSLFVWLWNRNRVANRKLESHSRDLKSSNEALGDKIREKEILMDEVHHRVKNNFSVILNFLRFHAASGQEEEAKDEHAALWSMETRIMAMAAIQDIIYSSEDLSRIGLEGFLEEVMEACLAWFDEEGIDYQLDCDELIIPHWKAMLLGTIVSELMTNSYKHGWERGEVGTITLTVKETDDFVVLTYADSGKPIEPGQRPSSPGMGTRILESAVVQLKGEKLAREDKGVKFKFRFQKGD